MENRTGKIRTSRRVFLQAAAGTLIASELHRAFAEGLVIPQVQTLTLQVVVDNTSFGPFLPNLKKPGLQVIRSSGGSNGPTMSRRALMAEFGLSVLAESREASTTDHVLIDFGYSPEVLRNNLNLLAIDTGKIDATVLSHGHLDHYGGFAGLLEAGSLNSRRLPLFVGSEEAFCERLAMVGTPPPVMGTLDRQQLAQAGFDVQIAPAPRLVGRHAFTTGRIPLQSFERAAIPTQMRPGVGCAASVLSEAKRSASLIADDGEHELATCYVVKGLGLVVIASCSHRGVLNSVRQAQAISGISKVHAVVGGFHLVRPRTEEEARRTVAEFVKIDPTYIVPMHCTGEDFIQEALRVMPEKIIRPYVGTKFVFESS